MDCDWEIAKRVWRNVVILVILVGVLFFYVWMKFVNPWLWKTFAPVFNMLTLAHGHSHFWMLDTFALYVFLAMISAGYGIYTSIPNDKRDIFDGWMAQHWKRIALFSTPLIFIWMIAIIGNTQLPTCHMQPATYEALK